MSEKTVSKVLTPIDVVNSSISGVQTAQANFTQLFGNKQYENNINGCFQRAQRLLEELYALKFAMLSSGETADLSQSVASPENAAPREQLTIPTVTESDCCKNQPVEKTTDAPASAKLSELIQRIRENDT